MILFHINTSYDQNSSSFFHIRSFQVTLNVKKNFRFSLTNLIVVLFSMSFD